jgi:glyoxylase-like metal-dependent hydrolase (beta-lactamase superfamily II)
VHFVDEVHHAKEEKILFEQMRKVQPEVARGPIAVMERDHAMCRAFLRGTINALEDDAESPSSIARAMQGIRSYVSLMRAHIAKEDQILYPLCARVLGELHDAALLTGMLAGQRAVITDADYHQWFEAPARLARREETMIVPRKKVSEPLDARSLADLEPGSAKSAPRPKNAGARVIYDDGEHQNLLLHDFGRGLSVQANQYLIVHKEKGMILDPGGPKVYPQVFAEAMVHLRDGALRYIFLSHQDPDIGTSLNAWLMDTDAAAYTSRLWVRFIPHFGIDKLIEERLNAIPDDGMVLELAGAPLMILPAHFLHSPGNFHVYDPRSKVLFSGDLGASLSDEGTVVDDFDAHIPAMLRFHQRYMAGQKAARLWAKMVRKLDIETIAPQHGAMFRGRPMVSRFIDWVESTPCGLDLLPEEGWSVPEWAGSVDH